MFVGLLAIFAVAFVVSLGFLIRRNARVWGPACVLAVGAFGVMYGLSTFTVYAMRHLMALSW